MPSLGTVLPVDSPSSPDFTTMMRLDLDFPLLSKSNYRRGVHSKDWSKNQNFERAVAALALQARPSTWNLGLRTSPLAKRPTVVMAIFATSLLDTANLSKSLADALEGILYHNDASVRMVLSTSNRSASNQCTTVMLALASPGASHTQMRHALDALLDAYDATPSA
jgi:Holliday junction resolvase RusA-like endonuclease